MTRELQLEDALRNLLATIELHTDCMDGTIDREALDDWIEEAEELLGPLGGDIEKPNSGLHPKHFVHTWISVDDCLPDSDITVLVCMTDQSEPVWLGYHDGEKWLSLEGSEITVTHWSDIPGPMVSA